MSKDTKTPKGVVRVTEYEIDQRDIFGGERRRRPRPPVSVKHHDMTSLDFKKFLRRIGVSDSGNGGDHE